MDRTGFTQMDAWDGLWAWLDIFVFFPLGRWWDEGMEGDHYMLYLRLPQYPTLRRDHASSLSRIILQAIYVSLIHRDLESEEICKCSVSRLKLLNWPLKQHIREKRKSYFLSNLSAFCTRKVSWGYFLNLPSARPSLRLIIWCVYCTLNFWVASASRYKKCISTSCGMCKLVWEAGSLDLYKSESVLQNLKPNFCKNFPGAVLCETPKIQKPTQSAVSEYC